jgi:hypothetical protein
MVATTPTPPGVWQCTERVQLRTEARVCGGYLRAAGKGSDEASELQSVRDITQDTNISTVHMTSMGTPTKSNG